MGAGVVGPDGEGVVGEDVSAFAVAEFGGGDDAVEGGEVGFEFKPPFAAAAGGVEGARVFEEDAFVAAIAGGFEGGLDLEFGCYLCDCRGDEGLGGMLNDE